MAVARSQLACNKDVTCSRTKNGTSSSCLILSMKVWLDNAAHVVRTSPSRLRCHEPRVIPGAIIVVRVIYAEPHQHLRLLDIDQGRTFVVGPESSKLAIEAQCRLTTVS